MTFIEIIQSDWFICLVLCAVHLIYEFVNGHRLGRKMSALCNYCGLPVYENSKHTCPELTDDQLKALTSFVLSLKVDSNHG